MKKKLYKSTQKYEKTHFEMLIQQIFILLSFYFILGTANHKYVEKGIDGLIERDIQLTDVEGSRVKRQILTVVGKWPNGVVNYSFDNGISRFENTGTLFI